MVRRSAKIAVRVGAVVLGVLVIVSAIFVWRAMTGPVSLGLLTPRLEAMINSGLKDFQLRFGDSIIEWSEGRDIAFLQFVDVEALDRNGAVIARVPRAKLTLSGPALLNGEVAPTNVELVGASALMVRRADGGMQLGFQVDGASAEKPKADGSSEGMTKAILSAMLAPKPTDSLSRYLKRFAVTDAKLTIFDESTRSYWTAEKASLTFDRKADGVIAAINAPVRLADKSTWLFTASGRYTNGSDNIALEAAFKPVRLKLLAASGAGLQALKGIDIPIDGNATCDLSIAGKLGRCKLWLNAGAGLLTLPALKKEPLRFKRAALTVTLDTQSQRYAIEQLSWSGDTIRGEITGDGAIGFSADGGLSSLTADWTAENVSIDAPNVFDGKLALESMKFRGAFDAARKHLTIEEIHARRGTFDLALAGELQDHPVSMGVVLNGKFSNLSVPDLKRLWPAGAAQGARDWISANVHDGAIRGGTIAVNILPGAVVDNRIPDEMMNIAFTVDGMKLTYLNGLPDLTKVNGSAVLLGDTFKADIVSGNVGTVSLKQGTFVINELHKHGSIGTIDGVIAGPTRDMLTIIDYPRLGYPKRYGISPAQSGGTSSVKFNFAIPMLHDLKAEDVGIDVEAELKDVKLPINDQLKLTGGTFIIKVDAKAMKAHGAVQVNGAPMGFTWSEDFTGALPNGTRIDVTATLDERHRTQLGLDMRPYVEGRSTIVAAFTGNHGKIQKARIDANLTSARLAAPQLGWAKPEDAKATLKADIVFNPDKTIEIANIDATGQGMKALGRLVIGKGKIREADFKKLRLGEHNDFAINYRNDDERGTSIDVKGRVIDAGGFFGVDEDKAEKNQPAKEKKTPFAAKANVDLAYLQGDVWFTGLKFAYADDGERLTEFSVDASADAANLRGELIRSSDNSRKLRLHTADAGRMLRGLTGFRSLIGGELSLSVDLSPMPAPGQGAARADPTFDGVLKVEKFKIVDQPFLARLLSAGSFTGLDDLMRGEGITFSKLEQSFQGRGGMITLTDGRAAGPAIGLTVQGMINRDADRIDVNGTVVPLYGLNSMFEDIPLLGDILTSRKGEGIFGVTYGVSGHVDNLKIAVNPISVLAPGFLRKIFQMGPTPQAAAPMPTQKPAAQNNLQPPSKTN
ncbi:MAG: AsmA-like C-terminal region-containing protein [Micropepsaceae bacterium]